MGRTRQPDLTHQPVTRNQQATTTPPVSLFLSLSLSLSLSWPNVLSTTLHQFFPTACLLCSGSTARQQNSHVAPRHLLPDDCCRWPHDCARPGAPFYIHYIPSRVGAACCDTVTATGHRDAPDRCLANKECNTVPLATCHA
jgi:hypothetical protein